MKRTLFFFLLLNTIAGAAQTRNEFWCKLNIIHPLNKQWSVGLDLHHRRQANYRTEDKNIFRHQLGNYVRSMVYYQLPKKWTILMSPIGYFGNEDILNASGELKLTNELRISLGAIKAFDIGSIKNKNRFQYDIRFPEFDKANHYVQTRFRLQNNFSIPIHSFKENNSLNYFIWNEIFIRKQKSEIGFELDRVYNALQWKFNRSDIDLGYQWVVQKGTVSTFHRNQLFIIFNLVI